jgi:DNA-binding SARP family transcriptional activator
VRLAQRVIEGRAARADLALEALRGMPSTCCPAGTTTGSSSSGERVRQHLLHGLEALSRALSTCGRQAEAVEAAMTVVAADPLRDSAHRALVEAHLQEGNVVEARRAFHACGATFREELGIEPSPAPTAYVRDAEPGVTLLREHAGAR